MASFVAEPLCSETLGRCGRFASRYGCEQADMLCISAAVVALVLSLAMYSHLSLWMPSLEAQLWYVGASSPTWAWVDIARNVAVVCCLLSLAFECAVTGTVWDVLPFLPVAGVLLVVMLLRQTLSRDCKAYLDAEVSSRAWERAEGEGGADLSA